MTQTAQDVVAAGFGNSPRNIRKPHPGKQTPSTGAEASLDPAESDEVDSSIDMVYGDTLGNLMPDELRYILMSWRAAA